MLIKVAALTLIPAALVGGVVMNASVMMVSVDNEDVTLTIPVPLALAQLCMAFAPEEVKYVEVPEFAEVAPYLERIVEELQNTPDGIFVEVRDGGDHVKVYKEGGLLKVWVEDRGDTMVTVAIPFESMMAVVNAYDMEGQYFRTSRLVGALRAAPSGDLVHVIDGDDEVRIRMW